ncbi:tetratricopeptide repeat protein 37 isoform X2 [Rhynchophorus ferrugineus]
MALLFLGFALQEVGPVDQAPKAFQKAVDLNPSNPLGFQGFINYYEKINTNETKPELIKSLLSYLEVESNEIKLVKHSNKLMKIYKDGDICNICQVLWNCSKKCTKENKNEILKLISEILQSDTNNNIALLDIYLNCMPDMVSCSMVTHQLCSNYLSILYKGKLFVKLYENAINICEIYPNSVLFLSWICKMYNELYILEFPEIDSFHSEIEKYKMKLLQIDPNNAVGIFTEAVLLVKVEKMLEARDKLKNVTMQRPGLIYAWILLTDVLINLGNIEEASNSLDKTKKLLGSVDDASSISKLVTIQEVKILSRSNVSEDWRKVISLYSTENYLKDESLFYLALSHISLENYLEADKLIFDISNQEQACILKVKMYKKKEMYTTAIDFMKKYSFNSAEWWMELGTLYWNVNEYERSRDPFLKAAKCNPDSYQSFYWLGQYYSKFNQIDKARRCFEKAFRINSESSEVGSELSKVYRKLKNWDANLNLLTSLSKDVINKRNSWAWFQLGLTYFDQGDTENSIKYLRMAVRFNPDNVQYWESLADAYFTRGSFKSALKCYEKASVMSDNSLYTSLQVANIKKILGEYLEAQISFENILQLNTEYIPALKGLAEAALCQARIFYKDERLERAWEYAQMAATKISLAILQRSELLCLWKILGDIVYFIAKLPAKQCCLQISRQFFDEDDDKFLEQEEVLSFATKCFCKAVSLAQDSPFLWQDLAVCYLDNARHENVENSEKEKLLNYAIQAAHKCIELDSGNWQYWNLLGCIHYFKDSPANIIQHCFIKAITADHNTAVSWTNLGVLYLLKGDIKLANKAFSEGQRADPDYVSSWIGQALIAESMDHRDTMGLFRHSIQLDHHEQGCLGYANCVCETLLKGPPKDKDLWYSLYDMYAVPVANDAIRWYLDRYPTDGCAWNLFGILQERMGLINSAKGAFQNAFLYSDPENRKKARINLGRLQYRTGNFAKAIQTLSDSEEATFNAGSALALALYKSGYYEESYSTYEQALHWLATEQANQSDILVALASMAYKFKGLDMAKDLLFQSLSLKPVSPWSLYATLSLALIHKDEGLAKLVCKELSLLQETLKGSPLENSEFIYHYVTLLSYYYITRNNKRDAKSEISKLVHKFPNESSTWLTLSMTIFRMDKTKRALKVAAKCAQTAIKLGRTNMDVCKILYLVALSFQMAGDTKQAFSFAQKAVHSCPNSPEAWSMLVYIMISMGKKISSDFLINISNLIRDEKANECLVAWFDDLKKYSCLF